MRILFQSTLSAIVVLITIEVTEATTVYRTIEYYTVSGTTAQQIDKALRRKAPYLKTTGTRHPGVTTITFLPTLKTAQQGRYCRVIKADIDIKAKMELPKWKQRNSTRSQALAITWDVLSRDIKRHEESHIVIARSHASKLEQAVRALPARKNCDDLLMDIGKISNRIISDHDRAQIEFDKIEAINFEKRITRLLYYRLKDLDMQAK